MDLQISNCYLHDDVVLIQKNELEIKEYTKIFL